MIRVELKVGKSIYKISCSKKKEAEMIKIGEILNDRINKLAENFQNTDEKTLLVIAGLMMEEEIKNKNDSEEENREKNKFSDQDMYNMVSKNIENVAEYVEKLTEKIQNY